MSDLSYKDHCRITRTCVDSKGRPVYDEYNEPKTEEIYNDKCDFQGGGQRSQSIVVYNDMVYLPRQVMVEENDTIEVTTQTGRKRKGIVGNVNDLGIDLTGDWVTEIEIKQSTEKQ